MIEVFRKQTTGRKFGLVCTGVSLLFLVTATIAVPGAARQGPQSQQGAANPTAAQRALLDQYCVTCHNQQVKTAGLMLDKADLNDIPGGAATWEKVVMKLRIGRASCRERVEVP